MEIIQRKVRHHVFNRVVGSKTPKLSFNNPPVNKYIHLCLEDYDGSIIKECYFEIVGYDPVTTHADLIKVKGVPIEKKEFKLKIIDDEE